MPHPEILGTLHNELGTVARRIFLKASDRAVTVWVNDVGDVCAVHGSSMPPVPPSWMAGIFDSAASAEQIEDDLRSLKAERAKDWVFDPSEPRARTSRALAKTRPGYPRRVPPVPSARDAMPVPAKIELRGERARR